MASYEAHEAGREHDLVLLFKGFPDVSQAAPYLERAAGSRPAALHVDDEGVDLTAYLRAAARLEHRLVGFVNSFSEILAGDWLELLAAPVAAGAGAAGATGSWGGGLSYKLYQAGLPGGYADVFPDARAVRVAMHEIGGARYRGDVLHWIGNLVYLRARPPAPEPVPGRAPAHERVRHRARAAAGAARRPARQQARGVRVGERPREPHRAADRARAPAGRGRPARGRRATGRSGRTPTSSGRTASRTCSSPTTRRARTPTGRCTIARS